MWPYASSYITEFCLLGKLFFTGFIPIEETVKADSHAETINYLANRVVYKLGDVS